VRPAKGVWHEILGELREIEDNLIEQRYQHGNQGNYDQGDHQNSP
jgi:hypothetical protein